MIMLYEIVASILLGDALSLTGFEEASGHVVRG